MYCIVHFLVYCRVIIHLSIGEASPTILDCKNNQSLKEMNNNNDQIVELALLLFTSCMEEPGNIDFNK